MKGISIMPHLKRLANLTSPHVTVFSRNAAGLGVLLLWQWLTVLKGPLFEIASMTLFQERRAGYVFFSLVMCAALLGISRFGARFAGSWNRNVMWSAAVLMTSAWFPAAIASDGLSQTGAILVLSLPAVGSAIQIASWEWMLSRSPGPHLSAIFGSACAVRTSAILVLTLLLSPLLSILAPLLPFLSARLWSAPTGDDTPKDEAGSVAHDIRLPAAFILRAGSFFVVSAMFVSLFLARMGGRMGHADVFSDPFATAGALAVAFYLLRARNPDPAKISFCAEALLAIGFLSLAAVGSGNPFFPMACLQTGAGIFGASVFTEILRLAAQAKRARALQLVAAGQMTVTGSLLIGTALAAAIGSLASADGLPVVLTSGLLGIGVLFFSGLFFRNVRPGEVVKDLSDGTEDTPPETPASYAPTGEELLALKLLRLGLSRQEACVALLVAQGQSNEDIAGILCITVNTVRSHMKSIHRKTGSSRRSELREYLDTLRRP